MLKRTSELRLGDVITYIHGKPASNQLHRHGNDGVCVGGNVSARVSKLEFEGDSEGVIKVTASTDTDRDGGYVRLSPREPVEVEGDEAEQE
jgi:hypothetical protein